MTRLNNLTALTCAVLIFTSSSAFAEMADGTYNHDFSGEVPLWDISGSYSDSDTTGSMDYTLNEDQSGALTGTGTFNLSAVIQGVTVDLHNDVPVIVTGKVKSAGKATRVSTKFLIAGSGTVDTIGVTFTVTLTTNSEIDGAAGQLVLISGRANLKVKVINTGRRAGTSIKADPGSTLALPAGSDGDWNLTLDLAPFDSKKYDKTLSTATVEPSTGNTSDPLTATGSYAIKTDKSKITLKGPKGTGNSLNLVISTAGPNMIVHSAKGKLYGQNVKFIAPP